MTNRRHDRAEIEHALARREAQGWTFEELARRTRIPAGTLSYWSQKIRREADEFQDGFVQLVARKDRSEADSTSDASRGTSTVRIEHPAGAVIEFTGAAADVAADRLLEEFTHWS